MDAVWQACLAATAALSLMLIIRGSWSSGAKRKFGAAWACLVIIAAIGCDVAYPRVQRRSAMASVQAQGGRVTESDLGIVVDLSNTLCDDAAFKRMLPRLKHFDNLAEIRLRETNVTDVGLEAIRKTWPDGGPLKRLDATGSKITPAALSRLKRTQTDLITIQDASESRP